MMSMHENLRHDKLLKSRASTHVTSNWKALVAIKNINSKTTIKTFGEKTHPTTNKRHVLLDFDESKKEYVLYVLGIKNNIFSMGHLVH
jgi:hypothetical protein